MIKAIIFDMDGLIVNTETLYSKAVQKVIGKREKQYTFKVKRQMMGRTGIEAMRILKDKLGLKKSAEEILKEREKIYGRILSQTKIKPFPGTLELLKLLNALRIKKALASSSSGKWIKLTLKKLNIAKEFKVVVSGDEVKKGKPNPEIYLLAAKRLDLSPQDCLVLEDSLAGVKSAKRAGMKCIAVPNKYTKGIDFSRADKVVNSLEEINYSLIKQI